jgi:hypothetical protein
MRKFTHATTIACLGASIWASPALAQQASSSAYALGVNQTVTAPNVADVNVSVGPLAATSGSAPPSYNNSASVASLNQTTALNTTGLIAPIHVNERLSGSALSSNSTGTSSGAQATATILNAGATIGADTLGAPSLFSLMTTTTTSFSSASAGGLTGSSLIEGLNLTGSVFGSTTFDALAYASASPNTVLWDLLGLKITLNEQILSANGIATNAIHVSFTNFAVGTGLKNGDIILAHTQASYSPTGAVPEPATWAMMLLGFSGIGMAMRRRRKPALAQIA